ncbi:DUF302 domain-containing protein [Luteibacter pinisoli]|uniref:DUF302 domain-containing protein n=1 Tax=Luteibacter pinisoli TaxID=2589080 RepID=A0A4Y5Z2Q3_9GAMM|nr:DUF302 domain-containing protein [Luteibacter pinisoli]QDE39531.1 DUF302 domain-containing protein [Luteibacter pinisoli]
MIVTQGTADVPATEARLRAVLAQLNVPVFATFDHAANAKAAGLSLRPTVVLVFGNPAVGTHLMQDQQAMALDLPLRVAIWEDAAGLTWLGYHDLRQLAANYHVTDDITVSKLAGFMETLIKQATESEKGSPP